MVWLLLACAPGLGERSAGAFDGRCADCHPEQAAAFATSSMARARTAPDPACDSCHRPGGAPGVTCLDCHAAVGNLAPHDGLLVRDLDGPIYGPRGGAAPHGTAPGGFLMDGELCRTCHVHSEPGDAPHRGVRPPRDDGCIDCHRVH